MLGAGVSGKMESSRNAPTWERITELVTQCASNCLECQSTYDGLVGLVPVCCLEVANYKCTSVMEISVLSGVIIFDTCGGKALLSSGRTYRFSRF